MKAYYKDNYGKVKESKQVEFLKKVGLVEYYKMVSKLASTQNTVNLSVIPNLTDVLQAIEIKTKH